MMKHPLPPLRFVLPAEVKILHRMILAAVDETVGENAQFKAFEQARFNRSYIRALMAADPGYAQFAVTPQGKICGFLLSGPNCGTLVLYWCYLLPEFRKGALALSSLVAFNSYWNNSRFHKIVAYAKVDNRVSLLMMRRTKYRDVAVLQNHIYGQDFVALELPLQKASANYDNFVGVGLWGRIKSKWLDLVQG
jgi:hypothetical protein